MMNPTTRRAFLAMAAALPAWAVTPLRAQEGADPRLAEIVLGTAEAPVELIEYASFTCPHCARFHGEVLPRLREIYVDQGKLRIVFRSVFRNRYDLWATMVARCGETERIQGLIAEIFRAQPSWTQGADDAAIAANLQRIGILAAIPQEKLAACMGDQAFANALVKNFMDDPLQKQVEGTPTFFINGEKYGNMAYEEFARVIDAALD
ncbi:MAG TPA: DsbA family protein [Paracoccaceae bacterium]|nr:DsbA family protein [Paracoccaceae bacterium]